MWDPPTADHHCVTLPIISEKGNESGFTVTQIPGMTLFKLPFVAKMEYLDLAGNQLLLLGMPFFRCITPRSDMRMDDLGVRFSSRLNDVLITKGTHDIIDDDTQQAWLQGEHIHLAYRWCVSSI